MSSDASASGLPVTGGIGTSLFMIVGLVATAAGFITRRIARIGA